MGLVFHDAKHFGAWNAKFSSHLALAFPNADALNMLYPFAKSKDSLLFLSLFISSTTAHTSSLHLHVLFLSTPKLDSHYLASPLEIEIHCQTLPVSMRPTFLSSENTQNRLFFSLFPNSNLRCQKFSCASKTWHCKKFFSLFFSFEFFCLQRCVLFKKKKMNYTCLIKCFCEDGFSKRFILFYFIVLLD